MRRMLACDANKVRPNMAAKRNVLFTLTAYAGDSDSETDTETGTKGGLVSAAYGDDDISRMEEADELEEEDESSSPLEGEDSETELLEADGIKVRCNFSHEWSDA
ncbi:hypothetical protein scyTo_0019244 [Scyliorhinus torazame]|uniref:Uncharacterized protein n=1 Tax=Scyliorhinus torazame TaxID=75743 RepID=A0A401PVI0_SCYTO|nr:hypothetical protein [Scyliorhinus torazame]